jgi:hypothetical protein
MRKLNKVVRTYITKDHEIYYLKFNVSTYQYSITIGKTLIQSESKKEIHDIIELCLDVLKVV